MTARTGAGASVVLYTCTFFDYDQVLSPMRRTPGVDYVIFSDRPPRFTPGWRWLPLPEAARGMNQTMANRYCKFFAHRLFPDADVTIYVDGNTLVHGDLQPLVDEFRATGAPMGVFRHQTRRNIAEERAFCLQVGKLPQTQADAAAAQTAHYAAEGLPADHDLFECGVLLRRGDAAALEPAMALWWAELERWVRRDQLSLPFVLHRTGLPVTVWDWDYKADNPYFFRFARYRRPLERLLVQLETAYRFGRFPFVTRKLHGLLRLALRWRRWRKPDEATV